ncbi:MAG: hypothetical protein ACR5K6_02140 [Wolbachia sp.]
MVEVSKEEGDNIENSYRMNDTLVGKQLSAFASPSPSPQVFTVSFTPQLDVSYVPPPQSTAENSEYAQPLASNEDDAESLPIYNMPGYDTLDDEQPYTTTFSFSQSLTNPPIQRPNSVFGSPQTAPGTGNSVLLPRPSSDLRENVPSLLS